MSRKLTKEEIAECRYIYAQIEALGINVGDPSDRGKWWNYDTYYDLDSEGRKYQTKENPFVMGGPESSKGFVCRKWEIIAHALYVSGYPCDLQHCIKYYVLAGINDDWRKEGEIAGEIIRHLEFSPECV